MLGASIEAGLKKDLVIDITTVGRRSGLPRRTEIWFYNLDGDLYITGTPGTRDWYANLTADPDFTFHLKGSVRADLPAKAILIRDKTSRQKFFDQLKEQWPSQLSQVDVGAWIEGSPLVRVEIVGR